MASRDHRNIQISGWVLFILSALLFIWSTARAGDMVGLAASLLFLIACLVFLVPIFRPNAEETSR